MSRDTFVALFGAFVIVLAAVGLFVVEGRAGPVEGRFVPSEVPIQVSGSYQTSAGGGTRGPGGTCVPDPPATMCPAAGTELDLRISGLPTMDPGHYVLFLSGGSAGPERIGTLAASGDAHTIALDDDEDRSDRTTLLVTLERDPAPASPSALVVHRQSVGLGDPDEPVDLATATTAVLERVEGTVLVDQIGMVSVSATAKATLADATPHDDWVYHAWFRDDSDGTTTFTHLDPVVSTNAAPDEAVLDARVERVLVDAQDAVVVTLEPAGVSLGAQPVGWPVAVASL